MSDIILFFALLCLLAIPFLMIAFIISWIKKKNKKPLGCAIVYCFVSFLVLAVTYSSSEESNPFPVVFGYLVLCAVSLIFLIKKGVLGQRQSTPVAPYQGMPYNSATTQPTQTVVSAPTQTEETSKMQDNTVYSIRNERNEALVKSHEKIMTCVLCSEEHPIKWNTMHTAFGEICSECMKKLLSNNISAFTVKKHTIEELRRICKITNPVTNQYLVSDVGSPSERLENLIISEPTLSLHAEEVCYYQNIATAVHQKNVVTGRTSRGTGVSVRVAKGVSIRTGGGGSQVIRENVDELFDGYLYITNQRFVLLTTKYGFDVPLSKISQICEDGCGFQLYTGSKCYSVLTSDVKNILAIFKLYNLAKQERGKPEKSNLNGNKASSIITEESAQNLRSLKKLLDEEIITQEEFDAKKKQLLGL